MRLSGTTGTAALLVALAAVGGGTYVFRTIQENKRLEFQAQAQQAKLKAKEADAQARAEEAKAKEADARKAEADRKRAEAEAKAKADDLAAKRQEADNLKAKAAADEAAAHSAETARAAAEAETKKAEAAKAAADAGRAEQEKKAEAEALALKRAEAEQARAEADLMAKTAAKRIAEAALAKSENELKTAEANAAAEHDRKLRMYRRAETSRAEMLALERAERLLALEESGVNVEAMEDPSSATPENPAADPAETNAVVAVDWPETGAGTTPAGERVAALARKIQSASDQDRRIRAREHIQTFGRLAAQAQAAGKTADAAYYRKTLTTLVPNYVEIYSDLIDEARAAKDAAAESRRIGELLEVVPDWQRVSMCADLLRRDEAYYSRVLAGRVTKDEFVKMFRKLYDEARRDKGDRDERDEKVARICKVLATYVPDFEKSPEWR